MTRDNQPVVGMCKNCNKPVRAGIRGFNRDEQGRVSHKFNCTNESHVIKPHKWEQGQDKYNNPALICSKCGHVWKVSMPVPKRDCTS